MKKLVFYVFCLKNDFSLEIDYNSDLAVSRYIELVSIFWKFEGGILEIIPIKKMDENIRKKYVSFIEKYKLEEPKLNRLKNSLDKISNGEYFFTSNKSNNTAEEILFIANLVTVHNHTEDDKKRARVFEELAQKNDIFSSLLKKYALSVFDSSVKKHIGESVRSKRICRFCNKGFNEGRTFKLKAHAFSEALGNKQIVLNEECDNCNAKFGSTIENDFIQYLDVYRVFFRVRGKKGIPKVKFKNSSIENVKKRNLSNNDLISDDNLMVIQSHDIKHDEKTGELKVLLKSNHQLKMVNVYKTLCKFVLSTIDTAELGSLKNTIEWLSNEKSTKIQLPKVATLIENKMYVDSPVLTVYIRKDNDYTHPHIVAEFKFKSLIFIFILPFSAKDEIDFVDEKTFVAFWKTFKHYDSIKSWSFHDFSSVEGKKFQFNMRINQRLKH